MLVAVNNKNHYLNAMNEQKSKSQKHDYYCPSCKEPVFLKKGLIKQAHFTHFQKKNCNVFSESETEEHILGKGMLYQWFKQQEIPCQLEAYLPNLKQRPDLLIWLDEKTPIAIEFQCSALSAQRMIERTFGYTQNGYKVYWILGEKYHFKNKLTSFQRLFVNENEAIGCYFLELHVADDMLTIHYLINQQENSAYMNAYSTQFDLNKVETSLRYISEQLLLLSKKKQNKSKRQLVQSHYFLNRGRNYQVPEIVSFQKYIYKKGDSLVSLPVEVYLPVKNQLFIKSLSYFWKYLLLEWIMGKSSNGVISKKEMHQKISQMINNNELIFYVMPLISIESKKKCADYFIAILIQRGLLLAISNSDWIIQKEPRRYKDEKEKISNFLVLEHSLMV